MRQPPPGAIEADVVEYRPHPRGWTCRIRCPYCGKLHTHGAGPNGAAGFRVPHCTGDGRYKDTLTDYFIVDNQALLKEANRG